MPRIRYTSERPLEASHENLKRVRVDGRIIWVHTDTRQVRVLKEENMRLRKELELFRLYAGEGCKDQVALWMETSDE